MSTKHKSFHRLLSLVLCLCMVLGMMPAAVFAADETSNAAAVTVGGTTTEYETLGAAIQAVTDCTADDEAVVKLLRRSDLSGNLPIHSGVFTLDLNGFEITSNLSSTGALEVWYTGTELTVIDSGEDGAITGGYSAIDVQYGATVTINGGTFNGEASSVYTTSENSYVYINGGTFNKAITSGGITIISGGTIQADLVDLYGAPGGTIQLTLGKEGGNGASFPGALVLFQLKLSDVVGAGVNFGWNGELLPYDPESDSINGDVMVMPDHSHEWETEETDPTCYEDGYTTHTCSVCTYSYNDNVVAAHHSLGADGICTVCGYGKAYAVTIDGVETNYTNFLTALNAACSAESAAITLYQDVTNRWSFESGIVTLDLNGWTCHGRISLFGGTLTLKDSGETKGTLMNDSGCAIDYHSGKLILDESVDLMGTEEGNEAIRLRAYTSEASATVGSTGTENLVLPAGLVAVHLGSRQEVSVLPTDNTIRVHQHNWVDASCARDGYCTDCNTPGATAPGHNMGDDNICDICGYDLNGLCINLNDSYGDGWNGNAIEIYAGGELVETITLTGGEFDYFSIPYDSEKEYTFVWINADGDEDNYSNENSFSIELAGEVLYSCEDCSDLIYDEVFFTLCDHSFGEGVEMDATCTEKGGIYYTCSKCGIFYIENEVPALGHDIEDGTCTVCGAKPFTITVNMADSYGDGWNSNKLLLYCGNEQLAAITLNTDASGVWTDTLDATKEYTVLWFSGGYAEEVSYEILIDGKKVFEISDCTGCETNDVIGTIVDGIFTANSESGGDDIPEGSVIVGGVMLFAGEYLDLDGYVSEEEPDGGYAYFDGIVLTLYNFTYTGYGYECVDEGDDSYGVLIYPSSDELDLEILGTNTLTFEGDWGLGILIGDYYNDDYGTLTVSGTGTLNLTGENMSAVKADTINFQSGTVNIEADLGINTPNADYTMTMNGGKLNVIASAAALFVGHLVLNAGKIVLTAEEYTLLVATLTVNGGYLEVRKGGAELGGYAVDDPITLGENVSITSPENATISSETNEYDITYFYICNADGTPADAFIIADSGSEQDDCEHTDDDSDSFCDICGYLQVGLFYNGMNTIWAAPNRDMPIPVPVPGCNFLYMIYNMSAPTDNLGMGIADDENPATIPGSLLDGSMRIGIILVPVYVGTVNLNGGSIIDDAKATFESAGLTVTDTYHEQIAGGNGGANLSKEMYTREGYTLVGYEIDGVEYDFDVEYTASADGFVIDLIWQRDSVPFNVEVNNTYGTADTVILSNPVAIPGQDYVTTVSSTLGTGIYITGIYLDDTLHGNGIFAYDEETCTLTVFGEYVEEGMQVYAVPYVTLTAHMNGGSLREEWQYNYEPDANGMFTIEMPCGSEDGLFGEWDPDTDEIVWDANLVFEREGYKVIGYNTAADSSGTAYAMDEIISPTEDTEIYLIWECAGHTDPSGDGACDNCGEKIDVKFQTNAETKAIRLLSYVGDLSHYSKVSFRVTLNGVTRDLDCTAAYSSLNADGTQVTASSVFGEDAEYFVIYTLTGITEEMYNAEMTVQVIWTAIDGTVTEGEARTATIGDLF